MDEDQRRQWAASTAPSTSCCPCSRTAPPPYVNNVELGKRGRWRSNVRTYPGASSLGSDARRGLENHPTVVVSNAALVEQVPLPEITPDHYDRTFALNAKAPLFLVQKMLPMMGRGGSIILVSSAMHCMGLANHSTYAATKAALRSYSRT